jgi:hypothetical protein
MLVSVKISLLSRRKLPKLWIENEGVERGFSKSVATIEEFGEYED